jgi:Family of unknown function (DUF6698)
MKIGQDRARQTDRHKLNSHIIDMMLYKADVCKAKKLSGLSAYMKATRGFNNEETGRLLSPVHMDWNDPA